MAPARRLLLLLLLVATPAGADGALPPAPLFPGDARLARQVSVRRARIYLGELVEELGKQAQVPLAVGDERGPVSGTHLPAFLNQRSLREAMAALRDLCSHPFNTWAWQSDGRGGYALRPARRLAAGADAAREAARTHARAALRDLWAIARLPERQRVWRVRDRVDLFPSGQESAGLAAFLRALTPAQVEELIAGRPVPLLPPDREPPTAAVYWDSDERHGGPVLNLTSGGHALGDLRGSFHAWLASVDRTWRFRGDPAWEEPLLTGPDGKAAGKLLPQAAPVELLGAVARKQKLDILVDWSRERIWEQYGGLRQYEEPEWTILCLAAALDMAARPRAGIRLLRRVSALTDFREGLVSWPKLQALRRAADANGGILDLDSLFRIGDYSPGQRMSLLPECGSETISTGQGGAWGAILAFARKLPTELRAQMLQPGGLRYGAAPPEARAALGVTEELGHLSVVRALDGDPEARVAFRIEPAAIRNLNDRDRPEVEDGRRLVWEVRFSDGKVKERFRPLAPRRRVEEDEDPLLDDWRPHPCGPRDPPLGEPTRPGTRLAGRSAVTRSAPPGHQGASNSRVPNRFEPVSAE